MGAFEYTALDKTGREKKGVIEGDAPRHVRQQLRGSELSPPFAQLGEEIFSVSRELAER